MGSPSLLTQLSPSSGEAALINCIKELHEIIDPQPHLSREPPVVPTQKSLDTELDMLTTNGIEIYPLILGASIGIMGYRTSGYRAS